MWFLFLLLFPFCCSILTWHFLVRFSVSFWIRCEGGFFVVDVVPFIFFYRIGLSRLDSRSECRTRSVFLSDSSFCFFSLNRAFPMAHLNSMIRTPSGRWPPNGLLRKNRRKTCCFAAIVFRLSIFFSVQLFVCHDILEWFDKISHGNFQQGVRARWFERWFNTRDA